MLKPVQDIYTAVLSVSFLLLLGMTAATAVTILEQSGIVPTGTTLTGVQTETLNPPATGMPVSEQNGISDCKVIYHLASEGGEYVAASSEAEQDVMGVLLHGVYTCSGVSARMSLI